MGLFFVSRSTTGGSEATPRLSSFVGAVLLLVAFVVSALIAEARGMATATDQLWTAFQTILGVIVGFLGGEAPGIAARTGRP